MTVVGSGWVSFIRGCFRRGLDWSVTLVVYEELAWVPVMRNWFYPLSVSVNVDGHVNLWLPGWYSPPDNPLIRENPSVTVNDNVFVLTTLILDNPFHKNTPILDISKWERVLWIQYLELVFGLLPGQWCMWLDTAFIVFPDDCRLHSHSSNHPYLW